MDLVRPETDYGLMLDSEPIGSGLLRLEDMSQEYVGYVGDNPAFAIGEQFKVWPAWTDLLGAESSSSGM